MTVTYSYPNSPYTATGTVTANLVGDTLPSLRRKVAAKLGVSYNTLFLLDFTEAQQNDKGSNLQDVGLVPGSVPLTATAHQYGYYQASAPG